jgi:hypothetical protein
MAIDITDFKNSWLGKRIADPSLSGQLPQGQWYQCVSLVKEYLRRVHGLDPGFWGHAIDYWTKTNPTLFTKFDRVHTSQVEQGDIVILNGLPGNPYGHIGIATGGLRDATTFEMLEQNGSTGSGTGTGADAIRTRFVERSRVAGVLRPKIITPGKGAGAEPMINDLDNEYNRMNDLFTRIRGRAMSRAEFQKYLVGQTWLRAIEILSDDPEAAAAQRAQNVGQVAIRDNWQQQIADLLLKANALAENPTKEQLAQLQQQLTICKENLHVTDAQLEAFRKKETDDTAAADTTLRRLGQFLRKYLPW